MDAQELTPVQKLLIERIDHLHSFVQRAIPRRFVSLVSADDILQEVWIASHGAFESLQNKSQEEIDKWLTTITRNKVIDALRAIRAGKRGEGRRYSDSNERRMTS